MFEYSTQDPVGSATTPMDLWLMKIDGTIVAQPFVANASYPAWSRGTPRGAGASHVYIPVVYR